MIVLSLIGYFSKAPSHYSLLLLTIIVINCCGPYTFYGEKVIKACLNAGTHQVDISAEMQFIETMQLKYNDLAQEKGVYIISACGFGYIPFDLGTIFVENQFNGIVNSVEIYCEAGDYPGGVVAHYGTWESIVLSIAKIFELRGIRRQLYKEELPRLTPKLKLKLIQKPAILNGSYALIDPATENDVALRSQRFFYEQHKKRPVQIRTYMVFPKFIYVMFAGLCAVILGILTRFSCGTKLVLRYPRFFSGGIASHEGPTEEDMKNTSFIFTFYAEGWADKFSEPTDQYPKRPNKALYAKVTGPNPAYGSTCVAFLLSAITILKENHNIPGRGGVLPPGAAFAKTTLIEQLGKYENGMKFEVISTKTI